jgi:hypothetical protein
MNIKEHIEAGYYPRDENGHYVVPMRNGDIAWVYTTKHGRTDDSWPIAGAIADAVSLNGSGLLCWMSDGSIVSKGASRNDLMPPPPRKEQITRWTCIGRDGISEGYWSSFIPAKTYASSRPHLQLVKLTGEYEVLWDEE